MTTNQSPLEFKCSLCGTVMERGKVMVDQTWAGVLVAGIAMPHLFFESASGDKQSVLDWTDPDAAAHRCPHCGVVMLQGHRD